MILQGPTESSCGQEAASRQSSQIHKCPLMDDYLARPVDHLTMTSKDFYRFHPDAPARTYGIDGCDDDDDDGNMLWHSDDSMIPLLSH
eukprot:6488372-Amphidinium_carterae.1